MDVDGRQEPWDGTEAVARWFDEHVDALHAYVARRVGRDVADDVVAETFRRALDGVDRFEPGRGSPRAWLMGIATNIVRRHWRTEQRRLRAHAAAAGRRQVVGDPLVRLEDGMDAGRRLERLVDVVSALSPEERDVLVLVAWESMSTVEVAAVLGIPAGTVRSRLSRVRAQLRTFEQVEVAGGREHG